MDELIQKLKTAGKLRQESVGFIQIEGLLSDAVRDILEANAVVNYGERAPFLLAYQSMLKAGRSLLLLYSLRPADGAQHKTVVQVCEAILGSSFKSLAEQFETMRRKRNELTYEYGSLLSRSDIVSALSDADAWIRSIAQKVKEKNPQFNLEF
ncbi:MAG: hypothetical protein A3G33_10810 [Omnitrophica bacterium RIFCSPLOWO2_12_FULL_44_17]|uniref:HEPN domain-containing protein n=1 Tax=Candidatus Danuiimicrobium aquiferis TaxID=1801832 RepID=A0A1G1KSD1_9BACT|nr:MAG: hypothetical protein A3B72_03130 [Omnitrophica bacterium RIFCSPHIGHO2_02_FULL_45_28]OGW88965.1 MAG: hypothetical protein A3E74_07110 [Omnitrophica bacterium RIFCSPHIGHO2_12_FULL_44_12]OGW95459.1 MAG: hypothetical protein A3G33_10810 [Omnitrophica bacterium RIFCSPLOWO2_12_FULL_44_17]OGX03338.1 MAG: hypothetical protein A3J12_07445 [Omnitrophica bacterium RIFCSPLOWO2_02_FULL_44_11]